MHLRGAPRDSSVGMLYSAEVDDPYRAEAEDRDHVATTASGTVQRLIDALGQMSRLLKHLDDQNVRPHVSEKFEIDLFITKSYLELFLYQLEVSKCSEYLYLRVGHSKTPSIVRPSRW